MDFHSDVLLQLNKLTRMTVTVQILPMPEAHGQGELLATFGGTLTKVAEGEPGNWYLWFSKSKTETEGSASLILREAKVQDAYWPSGVEVGSQFNVIHDRILIALSALLPETVL